MVTPVGKVDRLTRRSASQISSFFFVTTMRQAGCSIKEINEIIHNSSRDKIEKLANSKILAMQRELYLINKKISALHLGMWILEKFSEHRKGEVFQDVLPEISTNSTPVRNKESAFHTADIANDISLHLSKADLRVSLSTFPTGVTISYDDLIRKRYVYNSITSLSFLPADNVDSFPLPCQSAVCCYHDDSSADIERTYQKIVTYIKKSRLKACSDLFVISLINLYGEGKEHKYFKYLFICVEPENDAVTE